MFITFWFSFSLDQLISVPTITGTLIDHVLTNSSQKINYCGIFEVGIPDVDLVYCTRKALLLKFNKHNETSIRSMKLWTKLKFLEALKKNRFPRLDDLYLSKQSLSCFIIKLSQVIDLLCRSKKIKIKG